MPGAPFLFNAASYQGVPLEGVNASMLDNAQTNAAAGPTHTRFVIWLAIIGIILPVAIIGGLKVGGFQFVFKRG